VTKQTEVVLGEAFAALLPHLDERQRRLALGAAARVLGYGGVRRVARVARVAESTVARGARELGGEPADRVRAVGAGRKRLRERDPGLVPALLALVEPDQRGDPESPLRWTVKSTRKLAAELTRQGHPVGADTVAALLKAEGFSLQGTSRTTEGARHPDRDAQFRYSNGQVKEFTAAGQPVISVDTKKKEVLGEQRGGRAGVAPGGAAGTGARPRLPREGLPEGSALWHLRPGRRRRVGVGGLRWGHRLCSRSRPCAAGGTVRAGTATRRRPGC
jgi:hypothetical protein